MSAVDTDRDAAPVLAIIRAAGLPGFKSTTGRDASVAANRNDDADPVLAIVRAAGLPGFKSSDLRSEPGAPRPVAREPAPSFHVASEPNVPKRSAVPANAQTASINPRLSRQEYAILEIAPSGEAALADLESRMGCTFAADLPGGPCYAVSTTEGGTTRALYVAGYQRQELQSLVGELGTSALRLRFGGIPLAQFARSGAGATGRNATGSPPQLASRVPAALREALQ